MPYVSSAHRDRYQLIETAIKDFEGLLDKNNHENGHIDKDDSDIYRDLLDKLVVPNAQDGVLRLGRSALKQENYIPIWVLDTGEKYQIAKKSILPTQSQLAIVSSDLGLSDRQLISKTNKFRSTLTDPEAMSDHPAITASDTFPLGDNSFGTPQQLLHGRPRILLNAQHAAFATRTDVVAHELRHAYQSLTRPRVQYATMGDFEDNLIAEELEAYAHEGIVIQEMQRQGVWNEESDGMNDHVFGVITIIGENFIESAPARTTFEKIKTGLAKAGLQLNFDDYLPEERRNQPFTL